MPSLWSEVRSGLLKARHGFSRLASVGVDTWGVDYALVDIAGRLVFPVHAYRDPRTKAGLRRLAARGLGAVYEETGVANVFYNTSLQLEETLRTFPAIKRLADRCLFLPDYFNFRLSGRMVNELSIASTSQLLDVSGTGWSAAALRRFGVPRRWLSPPVKAGTLLGPVLDPLGMRNIQVVAAPGHDTACAYDAMVASPDGSDIYVSAGTWSLVGYESEVPLLGRKALKAGISNERTGYGRYRPLINVVGLWLLEGLLTDFAVRPRRRSDWNALITAAEGRAAPQALLDVDDPAFANPDSMREAIDAHLRNRGCRPPSDLAAYLRLICDSLGRGHAAAVDVLERLSGRTFKRILIVGGGAKNRLLCQATANASNRPVVALTIEGAAVGNLAAQLIALGAVGDLASFRENYGRQVPQRVYRPCHGG